MAKRAAKPVVPKEPTLEEQLIELEGYKDRGRAAYAAHDALVLKLLKPLRAAGWKLKLSDGRTAKLRDNFARGKNKHYKPAGVARFEIEFTRE